MYIFKIIIFLCDKKKEIILVGIFGFVIIEKIHFYLIQQFSEPKYAN